MCYFLLPLLILVLHCDHLGDSRSTRSTAVIVKLGESMSRLQPDIATRLHYYIIRLLLFLLARGLILLDKRKNTNVWKFILKKRTDKILQPKSRFTLKPIAYVNFD